MSSGQCVILDWSFQKHQSKPCLHTTTGKITERLPDNPASSFVFDFTDFILFHHVYMLGKKSPGTCCFPKLDFLLPFRIDLKVESARNPFAFHGFLGIHSRFGGAIWGANNQKRQNLISLDIIRNIIGYHPIFRIWLEIPSEKEIIGSLGFSNVQGEIRFPVTSSELMSSQQLLAIEIGGIKPKVISSHCGIDIL